MEPLSLFFREQGSGPGVVCLHSNAASSSQWRPLMDRLAPRFRVVAADSLGAGKSPPWPGGRPVTLQDEAELLAPAFDAAGERFVLVGHSYGAAVALVAALQRPERARALVLYEPTLFSVVDQQQRAPNGTDGIKNAVRLSVAALGRADEDAAARHFIDFWMGEGSWAQTPESRKTAIATAVRNVAAWEHALVTDATPLERFRELQLPVLLLTGSESPASGRAAARVLQQVLPHCEQVQLQGLGHMGPITHPEVVNSAIQEFLDGL